MIRYYTELKERDVYINVTKIPNVVKWGQLKLFLSETTFLSKMAAESKNKFLVLYIGAADGYHIGKLANLFPLYMFHLWDPRDFFVKESHNIKIFQKYFTDEEALKYDGDNILIICDIRTLTIKYAKEEKDINRKIKKMDEIVDEDLKFQKKWVEKIKPYAAFLKFRLPYSFGTTTYFDGVIYLQQFGPMSTETRLLVRDTKKLKDYDNVEYDEKMVYFNNNIRPNKIDEWENTLKKLNLKNNLDNAVMLEILKEYIIVTTQKYSEENLMLLVEDVLKYHRRYNDKYYQEMLRKKIS